MTKADSDMYSLFLKGEYENVLRKFNELVHPNGWQYRLAGAAYAGIGRYNEAHYAFNRAVEQGECAANVELAYISRVNGELQNAASFLAVSRSPDCLHVPLDFIRRCEEMAYLSLMQGNLSGARQQFHKALIEAEQDPVSAKLRWRIDFGLALTLLWSGHIREAEGHFLIALTGASTTGRCRIKAFLALIAYYKGDGEEAKRLLGEARIEGSSATKAQPLLSLIEGLCSHFGGAQRSALSHFQRGFNQSLSLHDMVLTVINGVFYGLTALRLNRTEEAQQISVRLSRMVNSSAYPTGMLQGYAMWLRAAVAGHTGNVRSALSKYRQAITSLQSAQLPLESGMVLLYCLDLNLKLKDSKQVAVLAELLSVQLNYTVEGVRLILRGLTALPDLLLTVEKARTRLPLWLTKEVIAYFEAAQFEIPTTIEMGHKFDMVWVNGKPAQLSSMACEVVRLLMLSNGSIPLEELNWIYGDDLPLLLQELLEFPLPLVTEGERLTFVRQGTLLLFHADSADLQKTLLN